MHNGMQITGLRVCVRRWCFSSVVCPAEREKEICRMFVFCPRWTFCLRKSPAMPVHGQTVMLYIPFAVLLSGGRLGQSFTGPLSHPHTQTPNYGCLATKYTNMIWTIFIDHGMTTDATTCNSAWTKGRLKMHFSYFTVKHSVGRLNL